MKKYNPDFIPQANRTYGKTKDCKGCRYWSEMIAKVVGMGPLQSLCLNKNSKQAYFYTRPDTHCPEWADGEYGAVDDPQNKGAY